MTENDMKRYYTEEHEWVMPIGKDKIRLGITEYAAKELGDVVYVELPEADSSVSAGDEVGTVESTKSASVIFSPVSGKIVAVNEELEDAPELVNEGPFKEGWMSEIELSDASELEELLSEEDYAALIAELAEDEANAEEE
ncbi:MULTISPECIES: glycine cleavage system protein GcvH [Carnobacterium]|uniref:Glycine cleavage system H protein n=1 Tax=Carnobacterium antarcticum TaxID=2126436 RepID=A0ABW4NLK4_9LACT|nr:MULTISPECIES: glycine cleavage system protein GcvH [unclassified Carnobacterium]ALV21774.1 Glycine cleavage system H protein [Carnobacterium sp. CP1]QQP69772.1 glycine cleavage system protein GcvH [Carnobacterium sp. CS13]